MDAFWPGPLTVIVHAQPSLMWDLGETHGTVALRVPDHAAARALLTRTGPLAVTSANLTGAPAATTIEGAQSQLGSAVSVYLDSGESPLGLASTIVDATGPVLAVVRDGGVTRAQLEAVVGAQAFAQPESSSEPNEAHA
jgi:tRNA threonylcarbamoyl adenosine modification protein (Sua5/YciO/YrdC/YwlC family)